MLDLPKLQGFEDNFLCVIKTIVFWRPGNINFSVKKKTLVTNIFSFSNDTLQKASSLNMY